MSVSHIKFSLDGGKSNSYLGGIPVIEDLSNIPKVPNSEHNQKLLLTLSSDFFKSTVINPDECLSVFISHGNDSINYTRNLAVNMMEQIDVLSLGYAKVLIHKRCKKDDETAMDSFKKIFISTETFTDSEIQEEVSVIGSGSEYSKLNGIPGWLQDNIHLEMKYQFWLQLNEYDLTKIDKSYEDVFRGGIGYLFLNRNIKKMNITSKPQEAGYFFIQFT